MEGSGNGYGSLFGESGLIPGWVVGGDGEIISSGREVLNRIDVHVAGIYDGGVKARRSAVVKVVPREIIGMSIN